MTTPTQSDEQRVKEKYPDAVASWTSRGWRILFNESPGMGVQIIGRTESAHVPESEAWADAASRLPKVETPRHAFEDLDGIGECSVRVELPGNGWYRCALPKENHLDESIFTAPPVAEPAPQTFEEWWNSDKQWEVARGLEGEDDCDECCRAYALAAWNAAKASSPAVDGGESAPVDGANLMPDVQIIRLGLGKVISNWGTSNGVPSVFIEPVLGEVGEVGQKIEDGREPQIKMDSVSAGGVIIEIHDEKGLKVLVEDLWTALHKFNEKHPEPLKCSDCALIHGKSVCTMNCGPLIKDVRGKE